VTPLFCWMIGGLFAISIYLLLSKQLLRWLFGIVILSSATTLLIFIAGRLNALSPPFIGIGKVASFAHLANPLSQALILTAIVIGFGLLAFSWVLLRKVWSKFNTLDSDQLRLAEPPDRYEDIE